jgi:cation transporter-like permease
VELKNVADWAAREPTSMAGDKARLGTSLSSGRFSREVKEESMRDRDVIIAI